MRGFKGFRQSRRYIQLDEDDGYTNAQFEIGPPPIPWNSILLAITLFVLGSLGIIFGALIKAGIIADDTWLDKGSPFLFLGSLLFIPGAYHLRIAYYAYKEYDGYDFDQIPDW